MAVAVEVSLHATPVPFPLQRFAARALNATTKFWFAATIAGQLLFAFTIASFYGLTAARGDFQSWNRFMMKGHVSGDAPGNTAVAIHLASAVVIILAGGIQFVPRIRNRFPAFHRWTGRVYVFSALGLSGGGLYIHWVRGTFGDLSMRLAGTLNAVLIFVCVALAVRYAIARDFRAHRRWAIRLFLVVSASWFFRAALFFTFLVFKGPVGFDPNTFEGPLLTVMSFAVYLVPLAIAELWFLAQSRPAALPRLAMATALVVVTLATSAGVFAISASIWVPSIKAAYDSRRSIAFTLSTTLSSAGIDQAIRQYRTLGATARAAYNFDEPELNRLGYQLLRAKKIAEAIRIFELNVEAYPKSANVYDSLAEAYLGAGRKVPAIANYRKSLQLNPNNRNAQAVLRRLGVK